VYCSSAAFCPCVVAIPDQKRDALHRVGSLYKALSLCFNDITVKCRLKLKTSTYDLCYIILHVLLRFRCNFSNLEKVY
jgi:hypothetical protein